MNNTPSDFPSKLKDFSCSSEVFELIYDDKNLLLKTIPFPEHIEDYYPQDNYISHQNSSKGFVNSIYQHVKKYSANSKARLYKKYISAQSSILDYGAGNGFLINQLKQHNFKAVGIEPNSYARKQANKNNIVLYSSLKELTTEKFSAISLWHVLEHIPNYKEVLNELISLLEPQGYLILALPNYKSWDSQHYKSYWAAYDVPRHAYHFSKESITQLAEEYEFDIVEIKPLFFDSYYVSYLSEKFKGASFPFIRGIVFGLISNLMGIFKKEYSSHIYVLQKRKTGK